MITTVSLNKFNCKVVCKEIMLMSPPEFFQSMSFQFKDIYIVQKQKEQHETRRKNIHETGIMRYSERISNQDQLLNNQIQLLTGVGKSPRTMLPFVSVSFERTLGCKILRALGVFGGRFFPVCRHTNTCTHTFIHL